MTEQGELYALRYAERQLISLAASIARSMSWESLCACIRQIDGQAIKRANHRFYNTYTHTYIHTHLHTYTQLQHATQMLTMKEVRGYDAMMITYNTDVDDEKEGWGMMR